MQPGYPPPGQDPYGQQPNPYGQQPPYQDPYAQPQYGQQPQYNDPTAQPPQYQDPYGQQPQQPPQYQDPYAQPQPPVSGNPYDPTSANPYPTSGNPYPTSPPGYPGGGYPTPGYGAPPQAPNQVMSILALVLGILSIPLACCSGIGFLPGVAGVVLGFLGMKKVNEGTGGGKGMAIAGLACGAVGILISVVSWGFIILGSGGGTFY